MKWLVAFLLAVFAIPLSAQERLALVIGNDRYTSVVDLQKAVADAEAVSDKLRELGFETIEGLNLDRRGMNERISEFTSRLNAGDTAFVFFAGHGVEIDGENYLLPTDIVAPTSGETDFVKSESIALSNLLDRVRATGARTSIAIVDACRDNPFDTVAGRSVGKTRGLGRINAPEGMFVIFSAGAGQMALDRLSDDEAARNSVFTRALLPRLSQPGLELRSMVADLRREVRDLSR
ncbi:MAG: caspase family protein, partial [Pseudomonadota bacterium]